MTLLYGWCTTNQHDTSTQRGPCPIQIGSAPPCRCSCHDGDDHPRGLLNTEPGYAPNSSTAVRSLVETSDALPAESDADPESLAAEGEDEAVRDDPEATAEPAETAAPAGAGDGDELEESETPATEALTPETPAEQEAAEGEDDEDEGDGALSIEGLPAAAPHPARPTPPAAPTREHPPIKVPRPTFTKRKLRPGRAARTHTTPDGMFTAYLTPDDAPEAGWYIALPATHVRFRKGKIVELETREGTFSGWRIGGAWVDRRTDQELATKQQALFDTAAEEYLGPRVSRLPQWAVEHLDQLVGPDGARGQRWRYELPVVELAARLVEAGAVNTQEVQDYLGQWRPTLFQQEMARWLAGEHGGARSMSVVGFG